MKNPPKYPLEVFWSSEDEGCIAIAPDLSGCSAWGKTEADALGEIHYAVKAWLEAAKNAGNPIPATTVPGSTSGKFLMRVHKRPHVDQ